MENSQKIMIVSLVYRLFCVFKQSAIVFVQIAYYWGLQPTEFRQPLFGRQLTKSVIIHKVRRTVATLTAA